MHNFALNVAIVTRFGWQLPRTSSSVTTRCSSTAFRTSRPISVAARASAKLIGGGSGDSERTEVRNASSAIRVSGWGPGWIVRRGCAAVAEGERSARKVKAPLLSHDAKRRPGEAIVGRRNPALHERGAKTVGPFQLDGVVIGHVARRVSRGEQTAPAPAAGPDRQLAREPLQNVPDVHGLFDHPVARPIAAAQPAAVAS